nr:DUF1499 domain-containing protein [Rhodothermaceae bacterium]
SKLVPNLSRTLSGFFLFLVAMAPTAMAQKASSELLSNSPFESCFSSLNCVHEAYLFDWPAPSELAAIAVEVLESNKFLDSLSRSTNNNRIKAVFNAWIYKDDVQIAIDFHPDEDLHGVYAILFIKSESREGKYDLGVNKRRVKGIVKSMQQRLK